MSQPTMSKPVLMLRVIKNKITSWTDYDSWKWNCDYSTSHLWQCTNVLVHKTSAAINVTTNAKSNDMKSVLLWLLSLLSLLFLNCSFITTISNGVWCNSTVDLWVMLMWLSARTPHGTQALSQAANIILIMYQKFYIWRCYTRKMSPNQLPIVNSCMALIMGLSSTIGGTSLTCS